MYDITLNPNIGTDDLFYIFSELLPVASKWRNIGLALRLTPDSPDTIGTKESVTDCLRGSNSVANEDLQC